MKSLIILMLSSILNIASAQNNPIGIFQANSDIGNPKKTGSAVYDKADQSYTLKGAGYNIWFERDEFHYLFNKIKGDFIPVSYTHLRAHETDSYLVCRLLLEKKKKE